MPPAKLSDVMIEKVARRFRALGEPQRLRILQVLEAGPRSVGEVVAEMNGNQPNVSRHLQELHDAGLLHRRRERNNIYYSIADPVVHELCALVCACARREAEAAFAALRVDGHGNAIASANRKRKSNGSSGGTSGRNAVRSEGAPAQRNQRPAAR